MPVRYLSKRSDRWHPPEGLVLVHNSVRPPFGRHLARLSDNGFRAWTQSPDEPPPLLPCDCEFAPQVAVHYRVNREEP